jgi:hypothetical protein
MIKIISLIVFIAAFIWTWSLFNSPTTMGVDIHAGIQSKLTLLIEDSVKAKRPTMTNFQLNKMYTEKVDDNKVKAFFTYQFDDASAGDAGDKQDVATQSISGEAVLVKALSEDPAVQKWLLQSVNTGNETLDFKEGITITSDNAVVPPTTETTAPVSDTEQK